LIIIPAAGEGSRFRDAGYKGPKHLLPLLGRPMVDWVADNVHPLDPHGDLHIITQTTVGKTSGAMETIRRALVAYPPRAGEPLVIANCDQLIDYDPEWVLSGGTGHGLIFTFKSASPAHSYVTKDKRGRITGIVEKPSNPPSEDAVSGVYYFTNAAAITTALKDARALSAGQGQETYFSVAIQNMIDQEYTLYAIDAPTAILGTPEDFQRFETAVSIAREFSL
jgi:dTDP-glucose pyrophosphorylase